MSSVTSPASAKEALGMLKSALGYLAAADATAMAETPSPMRVTVHAAVVDRGSQRSTRAINRANSPTAMKTSSFKVAPGARARVNAKSTSVFPAARACNRPARAR